MDSRLRVAIREDDLVTRQALGALLRSEGLDVTIEAAEVEPFLEHFPSVSVDVALVDLHPRGMEVLSHLARHFPHVRSVVLSGSSDPELMVRCKEAGAVCYIEKLRISAALLVELIQAAAA